MTSLAEILGRARIRINTNYQKSNNTGYVVDSIECRGITRLLHDSFYSNFKPMGRVRRQTASSSRGAGEAFHRQIYHKYKCKVECTCKARFGKNTGVPKKDSSLEKRVKLFTKFLSDQQWYVYDCEMIVGCPEKHLATSIDLVCVDNLINPSRIIIVELKTGYAVHRKVPRTIDSTGMMTGIAGVHIPNTFSNQHQLQLWFCCEAFKCSHGIMPTDAAVVYVNDGRRVQAEFAAEWWFGKEAMRKKMFAQLVGQR